MPSLEFLFRKYRDLRPPETVLVDPFARDCAWCDPFTNDLNPDTQANDHLDAEDYLDLLSEHYADDKVSFGLAILDPPWSNRQASEVYGTPNLYAADSAKMVRIGRKLGNLIQPGGYVIKCGYNTNPFHPSYECVEVRLVFHGGTASDTVFSVWKNVNKTLKEWIE